MLANLFLLVFLLVAWIESIASLVQLNLTKVAHNWLLDFSLNGKSYRNVADTGNYNIQTYDTTFNTTTSTPVACYTLSLDGTNFYFTGAKRSSCTQSNGAISVGSVSVQNVSYYSSSSIYAQNAVLHNWTESSGDFGMSYNYYGTEITPFQEVLFNSTDANSEDYNNQTFGLDFRDPSSPIASIAATVSTIQLGGVSPTYASNFVWVQQASTTPPYHQFFVDSFSFCGANIFSNYSNNWMVLVDTGAVCLSLPGEMYDTFSSWYSNQTVVTSAKDLPAISFTMSDNPGQTFYIPLGALVVDANAIKNEQGAPYVNIAGGSSKQQRLCVIKTTDIEDNAGNYNNPAPSIVFGSLVLQSLYFGANFATQSVGLVNKLSATEVSYYSNISNPSCAAPPVCKGLQNYDPSSNSCKDPKCENYFFTELDEDTKKCVYSSTAMGFGLFFIVLTALLEFASYFVSQYTASKLGETRTQPLVKIDPISVWIGSYLSVVFDTMVLGCSRLGQSCYNAIFQINPVPQGPNDNQLRNH